MKTKDLILGHVRKNGSVRTALIAKLTGLSRQTIAQHLRELISRKKLIRVGSTRGAHYVAFSRKNAAGLPPIPVLNRRYATRELSEDSVFQEVSLRMRLAKKLSPAAYRIAAYGFTEMLNNAIEHSKAPVADVALRCEGGRLEFKVSDRGVGAFESIRRKFKLKNHFEAVEHLLKGKQTTDPEHHSGQGIFFTSKIADRFVLESARLQLTVDNALDDTFLGDIPNVRGTRVLFELRQRSRKSLKALFDEYSDTNDEFDKTRITVHLSSRQGEYVSRSEARRLLFGLEKFRRIVLDFKKVKGIGQGFADEIFRVYRAAHPEITLKPIGMSESVVFMVRRTSFKT